MFAALVACSETSTAIANCDNTQSRIRAGFVFTTRTPHFITIEVFGVEERYEVLNVLEFTSARKRMSVILRAANGDIKLYTKGADDVIFARMAPNQTFGDATLRHLEEFASIGTVLLDSWLITLLLSCKLRKK